MAYLKEYPNIEKIVRLLQEQKQINLLLGLENNKIIHHITVLRRSENKFVISGLFKERYFLYEIMIEKNGKIINTNQCYEPLYISLSMMNGIISGKGYTSVINHMNIYDIYKDKEYLDLLHDGLNYIVNLNQSNIVFQKEEIKIKVYINHFYCTNEDKYIYGISFIDNTNNDQSITVYFDKENNTICYGYLSKFIENNKKKGFFITRDIEEVIDEIKKIAMF